MMKASILIAALLIGTSAFADDNPTACEQIQRQCGEAGFTRNLPQGRDLDSKCFQPIMKGQDVVGVKVDPDLVKKCKDEQTKKPALKKRRRH